MLTISLTSIPPRFASLGTVTSALMRQTVPARVVVAIPDRYRRFGSDFALPDLPEGVILRRPSQDYGPATKLLGVLDDAEATDILYCDDDWNYAPEWAETLLNARVSHATAIASSLFPVSRLKRKGQPGFDVVAQGFGGVLVRRDMFGSQAFDIPPVAWAVDDIWISGHLAAQGVAVKTAPETRSLCAPLSVDGPRLQDIVIDGLTRAQANTACADELTKRFGIWPSF